MFKPAQLVHRCAGAIKRLWAAVGLGLVVLIVALEATFIVQATTEKGCGVCHVPSAAHAEVARGPHVGLRCLDCHRTTSSTWFLERNLRAAQNLITQLDPLGEPDLSRAFVPSDICVTCHKEQLALARTPGRRTDASQGRPRRPRALSTVPRPGDARHLPAVAPIGSQQLLCLPRRDHRRHRLFGVPSPRPSQRSGQAPGARGTAARPGRSQATWHGPNSIAASRATRARSAHPVTASSFPTT